MKPSLDELIEIALGHFRSMAPTARQSILGQVLILTNVITSVDEARSFIGDPDKMLTAAEGLFEPTRGDAALGRYGALIRFCAIVDHVYLGQGRTPVSAAVEIAEKLGHPELAARIPLDSAQRRKAEDEWRSLRRTTLSPESVLAAAPVF
jgi:hypothetical protein